ncbi:MAG TPA: transglycosylase SLT domain-containing protein [bacterium]|nr:transglycosylase SLT domain-containing protein [bacterium]HPN44485.1 transglycosylase SLT domain-containing protein [bacterium]
MKTNQINNRNKKLMIVLFVFTTFLTLFLYHISDILKSETNTIGEISQTLQIHSVVAAIDNQRTMSINKVADIISRYNRTIPQEQKTAIATEIYLMSQKYPNLNIDFIAATITHESASTWDPTVISRVGAIGLMQIMPTTGAFLAAEEGIEWTTDNILYDPIVNIRLGCRYLSEMVNMYEKDGGLAAYNGGPKIAELWLASDRNNSILWAETRDYVPAVLKLYNEFRTQGSL